MFAKYSVIYYYLGKSNIKLSSGSHHGGYGLYFRQEINYSLALDPPAFGPEISLRLERPTVDTTDEIGQPLHIRLNLQIGRCAPRR